MIAEEEKGYEYDEANARDIEEEVKSDKIKAPKAVLVNKANKEAAEPMLFKQKPLAAPLDPYTNTK